MLTDLTYAIRGYRRTPGFTAVAILTLALGIGGATSIFSVVNGVLLTPLRYPDPDQLVHISSSAPAGRRRGRDAYLLLHAEDRVPPRTLVYG